MKRKRLRNNKQSKSASSKDSAKKIFNIVNKFVKHPIVRKGFPYVVVAIIFLIIGFSIRRFIPVALVNNKPVDRIEFNERLLENAGAATLQQMIIEDITDAEAERKKINVDKEFKAQMEIIQRSLDRQNATMEQYLAQVGKTQEEFEDEVRDQLIVKKLFAKEAEVTEEDIEAYFEETGVTKGEGAIYTSQEIAIRQVLSQDRVREAYSQWLNKKLGETKVINFVQL